MLWLTSEKDSYILIDAVTISNGDLTLNLSKGVGTLIKPRGKGVKKLCSLRLVVSSGPPSTPQCRIKSRKIH